MRIIEAIKVLVGKPTKEEVRLQKQCDREYSDRILAELRADLFHVKYTAERHIEDLSVDMPEGFKVEYEHKMSSRYTSHRIFRLSRDGAVVHNHTYSYDPCSGHAHIQDTVKSAMEELTEKAKFLDEIQKAVDAGAIKCPPKRKK